MGIDSEGEAFREKIGYALIEDAAVSVGTTGDYSRVFFELRKECLASHL